jgi:ABC-type transport system involved in multi-copper enzyme maturation permease subunit
VSAADAGYRSPRPAGRDGFLQLLHAEWTKFRTVRGWVVGTAVGALIIILMAVLTASLSHSGVCEANGSGGGSTCHTGHAPIPLGPDGEPVIDDYYLVRQPLHGNGSITVRVTSLTGRYSATGTVQVGGNSQAGMVRGLQPWSKAGVIVTAGTTPASPYAAVMVTGTHGVRMQYDYTHDVAGTPGTVSAGSARWLRLTRVGDTLTGYDSTDGSHWRKVGIAHLAGLPAAVQVGMFVASPDHVVTDRQPFGGGSQGGPSLSTGIFDHVTLRSGQPGGAWLGDQVQSGGLGATPGVGLHRATNSFTVTGSGDIAPAVVGGESDPGHGVERTLIGAFVGLIVLTVVATLFITGEYRRGLIRSTFAASPRRGRVLAAKALVIGAVVFVAGLVAAGIGLPVGEHVLRANGNAIYPASTGTELRAIIGTGALLAVAAVLALALGTILRRSALAVTAVILLIVLPYILAVASVLPAGPAEWLLRVTPAAAFAVQQTLTRYPQVTAAYLPANGYFPLAPWAGFAVLCGYTLCALGLAAYLLRRRDV